MEKILKIIKKALQAFLQIFSTKTVRRKIAVIVGSANDLKQCLEGLSYLKNCENIKVSVYVRSQHRNTLPTQKLLKKLAKQGFNAVIAGAGWAAHLPGCCDALLRYTLHNSRLVVIGVAFEDPNIPEHTLAAILSISEVPGTKVIFKDEVGQFVGALGFMRACRFAAIRELPKIALPEPKPIMDLTLEEAIEIASH